MRKSVDIHRLHLCQVSILTTVTDCGKVMFSVVSVCLFMGKGDSM